MMRSRSWLIALSACSVLGASAQSDSTECYDCFRLAAYAGVNFQKHMFWEAGLQWAQYDGGSPCSPPSYVAYRAGVEYFDASNGRTIAPKIGVSGEALLAFKNLFA